MTLLLLVAGEISPKVYASSHAEKVAARVALPIRIIVTVCTPASWLLSRISRIALRLSGAGGSQNALSSSEIISLLELGHSEGVLGNEALVTVALMTLEERQCSEAMCPRAAVGVIRTGWTWEKTLSVVRSSTHTLYPLLEGSLDKVLGFVDARDVLAGRGETLDVYSMPSFPEHAPLDSVLRSLRDSGDAMGAVYDEYGDWAGIITIEDILNYAVFHSMAGQTDLPDGVSRRGRGFVVPGMLRLDRLARLVDVDLPPGLAETCAGLFLETAGRVPVPGEEASAGHVRMTVLSCQGPRIDTLYVERIDGGQT
jgi:putative hemolysin